MEQNENSLDEALATDVEGLNGGVSMNDSDVDSDAFSDAGDGELSADKLDPADRELYEKLKQQEREEREEIERELKAHEEALARHQEELRLREKELHLAQERMQQRAKLDGGGDGGGGVSSGGGGGSSNNNGGGSGSANSGDVGNGNGANAGGGENGRGHGGSVGGGSGGGGGGSASTGGCAAGSGSSSNSSNNSSGNFSSSNGNNTSNNNNNSTNNGSSHGFGKHAAAPHDLRAHVHAAQLAALSHAAGLGYLGPFSPRDLKLDMHPLRTAAGVLPSPHGAFPQSGGSPPERYPRPLAPTPQPPSSLQSSSPEPGSEGRSHHWTFEEQFKQLYELSDDPQRKEFLDDLFAFMQKRGTPVNRIPIMAKQTLDLYELFRLVVSKGGLVEVINKKLWREITKGLNLPSSITSAAFTLRTQYMKYLYPYECDKLKLSSPQELQAAIDGNRREGRRSSYGYDLSPGPTLVPTSHHLNGSLLNGKLGRGSPVPLSLPSYPAARDQWSSSLCAEFWSRQQGIESWRAASPVLDLSAKSVWPTHNRVPPPSGPPALDQQSGSLDDEDSPPPTPHAPPQRGLTERDALAMEAASRAMEEATRKMEAARLPPLDTGSPPRKRLLSDEERLLAHAGMPSAHLKITSRNDGRSDIDNSLVVSMEVNGVMYQGVLFAQHNRRI